ncbi:MAG: isocitrate lyase [Elusimicrobia bacterium]|nr:MAG: isocitrate lyase [Elusimicrobiota bacterium]
MRYESEQLEKRWETEKRWSGIKRPYEGEDVVRLRGSVRLHHTIGFLGAKRLWHNINTEPYVHALGAMTGNQAVQQVRAGLKAIYVSGWQVAADANDAMQMYPDQSIYPVNSVPHLVKRINNALLRSDQIQHSKGLTGKKKTKWLVPLVADAEAGFGGPINVFELMKSMIEAGAAGVHFEDQLASAKKCGHMGGKVLVPTHEFITKLVSARLASDVCGIPTVIIARTDANAATLITTDSDERDRRFIESKERTTEGFFTVKCGIDQAIDRGLSYAPYADMLWCETGKPDLQEAQKFADAIHEKFPGKLLAYNCSPSFNWKKNLDEATIGKFQRELAKMGYRFQFVTLAGFHALNHSMFTLAEGYRDEGMAAYSRLQEAEFASETTGYQGTAHQAFVGTGYFDQVNSVVSGGKSSTLALVGSTEEEQFSTIGGK